jgi:predicted amidohydrolase
MKVAAFQARLLNAGSTEALGLIRQRVEQCEASGVTLLCCPEVGRLYNAAAVFHRGAVIG